MSNRVLGEEWCPFCMKVKTYFETEKIPFEWVDTDQKEGAAERQKLSKQYKWKTIPMVFVKGEFVGGCDDFFSKLNSKKITL